MEAAEPDYWRIAALDEYRSDDGGQWTLTAEGEDAVGTGLDEPVPGARARPAGTPSDRSANDGCRPRTGRCG